MVRSRGCSACCARRVYWNVNYFGVIRAVETRQALLQATVLHSKRVDFEHGVISAVFPSHTCNYIHRFFFGRQLG